MPRLYYKTENGWIDGVDIFYPVGAVYMSTNETSPAEIFGGTWSQLTNKFLYASTNTATGGSTTHIHHVPIGMDSPTYDHNQIRIFGWRNASYRPIYGTYEQSNSLSNYVYVNTNNGNSTVGGNVSQQGSINTISSSASSLPPYQGVYCWIRTA